MSLALLVQAGISLYSTAIYSWWTSAWEVALIFPRIPAHSNTDEIIAAFITQHYLTDTSHIESIPKQIIIAIAIT